MVKLTNLSSMSQSLFSLLGWIVVVTLKFSGVRAGEKIKVFSTEDDISAWSSGSGAKLKTIPSQTLSKMSICTRFLTYLAIPNQKIVEIMKFDESKPPAYQFAIKYHDPEFTFVAWWNKAKMMNIYWAPMRWHSFCFSYNGQSKRQIIVSNGKVTNVDYSRVDLPDNMKIMPEFFHHVFLGREATLVFNKTFVQSLVGSITDFNVWSFDMSPQDMIDWTTCDKRQMGDVIDWNSSEWDLHVMNQDFVDVSKVCVQARPGLVLIPETISFNQVGTFCSQLGGIVATADSMSETKIMYSAVSRQKEVCFKEKNAFWGGYTDTIMEGQYANWENTKNMQYMNWYPGEPNGEDRENCVMIFSHLYMNDLACSGPDAKICGLCMLSQVPQYSLRGNLFNLEIDRGYTWTDIMKNGRFVFRGWTKSEISWDNDLQSWIVSNKGETGYHLSLKTNRYPSGLSNHWERYSNNTREQKHDKNLTLSFSWCADDEFNCFDGSCIPFLKRCDGRLNCKDASDEKNCQSIKLPGSYLSDKPPLPKEDNVKLQVHILLLEWKVFEILEEIESFRCQVSISATWTDPRLTYYNLKANTSNVLSIKEVKKIWTPTLIFSNVKAGKVVENHDKYHIKIIRQTKPQFSGPDDFVMKQIFDGSKNKLKLISEYDIDILCNYKLQLYPFDEQSCVVDIVPPPHEKEFVSFTTKENYLKSLKSETVAQYVIKNVTVKIENNSLKISTFLNRNVLSVLLQIGLPCFLLSVINGLTSFFGIKNFEAAVTVNVTTLLTISGLFIAVSDLLPSTSYLKVIDMLLLFGLICAFLQIYFLTLFNFYTAKLDEVGKFPSVEFKASNIKSTVFTKIPGFKLIKNVWEKVAFEHGTVENYETKLKMLKVMLQIVFPVVGSLVYGVFFSATAYYSLK